MGTIIIVLDIFVCNGLLQANIDANAAFQIILVRYPATGPGLKKRVFMFCSFKTLFICGL